MPHLARTLGLLLAAATLLPAQTLFESKVHPTLTTHCAACHQPDNPKNRHNFLKASDATDIETRRRLWRDVATQLRNRTMPPGEHALPESARLEIATWIEDRLRTTGCTSGPYAGYVGPRRLNRREYRNTIRDLLGINLPITDLLAADESGGAGFDTNGDTLYLPPILIERYMAAAQAVADRVIITPALDSTLLAHELAPALPYPTEERPQRQLKPGEKLSTTLTTFSDGAYSLQFLARRHAQAFTMQLEVDGVLAGTLSYNADKQGGTTSRSQTVQLARGVHQVTLINGDIPTNLLSYTVEERRAPPSPDQAARHYQLLGIEPGQTPVNQRAVVKRMLTRLLPRAFRRPIQAGEIGPFLALYDRAAERGDPFAEAVKYALKAVLVSPQFLFRYEAAPTTEGLSPLNSYELASRLSYFLWASMPDQELFDLAAANKLQDSKILSAQVDRMLDDPRSRAFASAFTGQWLGTKEIGGRSVPLITELRHFYTPAVAADLREQPALFFHYLFTADRPLTDLIDAPYTFLTARLVNYYQLQGQVGVPANGFHRVKWPDDRRAGVLGFASILAMTSHYKQASPVLRGAWVLETLLGTPVPPPPPDVPELPQPKKGEPLPMREMLAAHRASSTCATCHNLMDPIGLGLENFDWMGRWRDTGPDDKPIDASGQLPSGESFNGPAELRQVLLSRQEDFLRQITSKILGYAIGRGQQDGDQCTIREIVRNLERNDLSSRTLIHEIVQSAPFRNLQIQPEQTKPSQ